MVVQSLLPEQFVVTNTVAVLDKVVYVHCRTGRCCCSLWTWWFRWMSTVGDLSAMYDKIDPALACDKAEQAISHLLEWTGRKSASWLNMSHRGGRIEWGKASRDC